MYVIFAIIYFCSVIIVYNGSCLEKEFSLLGFILCMFWPMWSFVILFTILCKYLSNILSNYKKEN